MWVSLNTRATDCLIKELEGRFPTHGLMDNLEVGYGVPTIHIHCNQMQKQALPSICVIK
jgi:hypothetical protein